MKVCIAQTCPFKGDIEKNIEGHLKFIDIAIANESDIIVFPELSLTGFEPDLAQELAVDKHDKRFEVFQNISDVNNITICIGAPMKRDENIYISMFIFQPNTSRVVYSKQYLHSDEEAIFTKGDSSLFINIGNEKIGFSICYETSIKEHSKYIYKNDTAIYIASVLNHLKGIDADINRLSNIAKTYEMTVFMSNYVGTSGGYSCAGKSSVWDTTGKLMEQLGGKKQGLFIYDTKNFETITKTTVG